MTAPNQELHPPEYYLKYMSWHTKDMAECQKQIPTKLDGLINRLDIQNAKLEQILDLCKIVQGKPHTGVAKVTQMPSSSEEVPF